MQTRTTYTKLIKPIKVKFGDIWAPENKPMRYWDGARWILGETLPEETEKQLTKISNEKIEEKQEELDSYTEQIEEQKKVLEYYKQNKNQKIYEYNIEVQEEIKRIEDKVNKYRLDQDEEVSKYIKQKEQIFKDYDDIINKKLVSLDEYYNNKRKDIKQAYREEEEQLEEILINKENLLDDITIALEETETQLSKIKIELLQAEVIYSTKDKELSEKYLENNARFQGELLILEKKIENRTAINSTLKEDIIKKENKLISLGNIIPIKEEVLEDLGRNINRYEIRMGAINEKEIRINRKEEQINKLALEVQTEYHNAIK